MRKFSEIERVNEEFFGKLKGKTKDENPMEFTKTSKTLMETYSKNLISDDFLTLLATEKEKFDFSFYKINSIERLSKGKYRVSMSTHDQMYKQIGELVYNLEIDPSLSNIRKI